MKTKPKDTSIVVSANTTVTVSIKGQKFTLTKEEAQSLAKSLVDSVGLPVPPQKTSDEGLNERFKKAQEEYDKQRPIFPPRPYIPDPWDVPQWPPRPRGTWVFDAPKLDYSKFPPGTLIR